MIAVKLGLQESEITDEASFIKDLGADSVDLVELVMDIENKFGITIPDHEVENFTTAGSLIEYVNRQTRNSFVNKKIS
jgi:acyl carrier protein